jgi:putative oxidoreductase
MMSDVGLLLLRISVGGLMLVGHGWAKLSNFSAMSEKFADPLGVGPAMSLSLAVGAEVGCSLLLILGCATRLAAIPLAFTMFIAFFVIHGGDPFKVKELALLYMIAFITILFTGAGKYSVDGALQK